MRAYRSTFCVTIKNSTSIDMDGRVAFHLDSTKRNGSSQSEKEVKPRANKLYQTPQIQKPGLLYSTHLVLNSTLFFHATNSEEEK